MNFNNLSELKDRVKPALDKRVRDLKKEGILISADEIWNNLTKKWISSHNLSLDEIVNDILKYKPYNIF